MQVIDQDYDEGYHDDVPVRRRRSPNLILGFGLLALSATGFTFAASITLGSSNRLEFGQGIYRITSCDQWVGIKLNPSSAVYAGQSRVANINISGLDALNCRGTDFKIQLQDNASAILPIYRDESGLVNRVLLNISSDQSKGRATAVSFYNGYGVLVPTTLTGQNGYAADDYSEFTYNANTGIYSFLFDYPQATMSAIYRLTVESTNG